MASVSNVIWNQTTNDMINKFYSGASVFKVNRFDVGFWGPYVNKAINVMNISKNIDPKLNYIVETTNQQDALKSYKGNSSGFTSAQALWQSNHLDNNEVRLRWTCLKVELPTVKADFESAYSIDRLKPIQYPLIKGYGGMRDVTLTVVEDRNMTMWQFFNALQNEFYTQVEMMPRSSFHKCGMWIAIAQEEPINPAYYGQNSKNEVTKANRKNDIDLMPVQFFEFNSVVIENISDLTYTNQQDAKHMTFDVKFKVPNTFQETYSDTLRGLRNNTGTGNDRFRGYGNGGDNDWAIDQYAVNKKGEWQESFFNYKLPEPDSILYL